jgi:hypothetical protein
MNPTFLNFLETSASLYCYSKTAPGENDGPMFYTSGTSRKVYECSYWKKVGPRIKVLNDKKHLIYSN